MDLPKIHTHEQNGHTSHLYCTMDKMERTQESRGTSTLSTCMASSQWPHDQAKHNTHACLSDYMI
jgi:hypothetical protein